MLAPVKGLSVRHSQLLLSAAAAGLLVANPTAGQVIQDRADPTITERALPNLTAPDPSASTAPLIAPPATAAPTAGSTVTPQAILVVGTDLPATRFAEVITRFVGKELDRAALAQLASNVANEARLAGYPLATASIEPQAMGGDVLRVRIAEGRIDAVRVIGASNGLADRLLSRGLVTGRSVRRADLERTLLMVGDLPGLTVRESRLLQEEGFNILLVTVAQDRASLYAQLDNRGSEEVGPIRSTILGSVRNVAQSGDEMAVLLSNTAPQLSEFAFVRGRYLMPFGRDGGTISVAGSFGRSEPGAVLKPFDIVGKSHDAALAIAQPILRTRATAVVAAIELRRIATDQRIRSLLLRRDRLTVLTATLDAVSKVGGGTARGQFSFAAGLPLGNVTVRADPLASRADGDARFLTLGFTAEWTRSLSKRATLVLASAGQLASRPLLATAEIGVGGPAFARGYDFAERTGDEGLLGSAELRFDTGQVVKRLVQRSQIYAFVDGGKVADRGPEKGGGTLASAGMGTRIGLGRFDAMAELAFPLNADRFDTGDKRPRISVRLSRAF